MRQERSAGLLPVIGLTVGATIITGMVAGLLTALSSVGAGGTERTTGVGLVLFAIAAAVAAGIGVLLAWRAGADAPSAAAVGTGTVVVTQTMLTVLARLGGATVGWTTVLVGTVGALIGGGLALLVISRRAG